MFCAAEKNQQGQCILLFRNHFESQGSDSWSPPYSWVTFASRYSSFFQVYWYTWVCMLKSGWCRGERKVASPFPKEWGSEEGNLLSSCHRRVCPSPLPILSFRLLWKKRCLGLPHPFIYGSLTTLWLFFPLGLGVCSITLLKVTHRNKMQVSIASRHPSCSTLT